MSLITLDVIGGPRTLILAGLALSVLLLWWVARRVRSVAKSDRPDKALSRVAMLIGLGWSSEAIWELSGRIPQFPDHMRYLVFFVLEVILVLSIIRADRHQRLYRRPGRSGTTAWIVASVMGVVAMFVAHSAAEALLRLAIPLLLTLQWWDGLVGEGVQKPQDAISWRWHPRRLLLWLGAIEPGENDVESVHRERLTQQMTKLEFRRRYGAKKDAAALKLSRLSLAADDEIVAQVRDRVDRSQWFKVAQPAGPQSAPPQMIPARRAASQRAARVRHRSLRRQVCLAHPRPVIVAAPEPRQDDRTAQDVDLVVRAMQELRPAPSQRRIAFLAALPPTTVRNSIGRIRKAGVAQPETVNGRVPDLEGAS